MQNYSTSEYIGLNVHAHRIRDSKFAFFDLARI